MYFAKLDDYYVSNGAVYYHVAGRLDLAPILKHRLNQNETVEEAVARWDVEQHWLADWGSEAPFDGFHKNCEVAFEMKSSTYYPAMKHQEMIHHVRNINVTKIEKLV